MKVDEQSVSAGYFNYCLYNMELIFSQSVGLPVEQIEQSWNSSLGDVPLGKYIVDMTCDNIAIIKAGRKTAAEKGIRIIPVASSGVNKETEYLLRSEALLSGGTYTFLTDDSGIGHSHLVPTVGEHTVEFLNSMMVRLICEFHTGEDLPPVDWRQEVK